VSFFLVPIIGTGEPGVDARRPKYLADMGVPRKMVDFGDTAIVWADTTTLQDEEIDAHADARLIPPLDNTINSGALNVVQASIEGMNVPAHWVSAGMTYRTVLRILVGMAQLAQRMQGLGIPLAIAGNLDTQLSSFSQNVRNALARAADDLGLDRSGVTGSTTVREALRICGQQFATGHTIVLGDL
jgi:hypothetical protein